MYGIHKDELRRTLTYAVCHLVTHPIVANGNDAPDDLPSRQQVRNAILATDYLVSHQFCARSFEAVDEASDVIAALLFDDVDDDLGVSRGSDDYDVLAH